MLAEQEIAKIERAVAVYNNYWGEYKECSDANYVSYIVKLLAERAELLAEVERLKKYNNDEDAESLRGFRVLYAGLKKEHDRLQTENEALKNALKYVSSSCTTCKHFGVDAPCEKCVGKNLSEYVFDYNRFKDGGGGDA